MGENLTLTCLDNALGIWRLYQRRKLPVNAYLLTTSDGLLLIDTGNRSRPGELLGAVRQVEAATSLRLSAILLTHGHEDHSGGLAEIASATGAPIYAHEAELPFLTGAASYGELPAHWGYLMPKAKPTPCAAPGAVQTLADGARLGPLRACHTPGHTPGHLAFYHEAAGIWFTGDVVSALLPWLHGPLWPSTYDIGLVRRSARRLLEAGPVQMLCMGHGGPVLTGAEPKLERYLRRTTGVR